MKTVAVIQPYFFPYAGYFRLFSAADEVVMFDCVQFPRRGWVHRNKFALANGTYDWLTLPIDKVARDARIDELQFSADAKQRLEAEIRRFPILENARRRQDPLLRQVLQLEGDVTTYLIELIKTVTAALGLERPLLRSSSLPIDPALRAQDRVLAIVRELGGTRYVNPSGGRELYDHEAFDRAGAELRFLTPYEASMESVLARLLSEPHDAIAAEIRLQSLLVP